MPPHSQALVPSSPLSPAPSPHSQVQAWMLLPAAAAADMATAGASTAAAQRQRQYSIATVRLAGLHLVSLLLPRMAAGPDADALSALMREEVQGGSGGGGIGGGADASGPVSEQAIMSFPMPAYTVGPPARITHNVCASSPHAILLTLHTHPRVSGITSPLDLVILTWIWIWILTWIILELLALPADPDADVSAALPPFPLHTQRRSPALCADTASSTVIQYLSHAPLHAPHAGRPYPVQMLPWWLYTCPTPFTPPIQASRADRPRPCTLGGCTQPSPILPTP